jgi:hypothetical protein
VFMHSCNLSRWFFVFFLISFIFFSLCLLIALQLVWITHLQLPRTRVTKMTPWIPICCIQMKTQVTCW